MLHFSVSVVYSNVGSKRGGNMKKTLSLFLALILCFSCCLIASAETTIETEINSASSEVMPRYTYLCSVSAGIAKKALGFVLCESTYNCMYNGYTFILTCTLQRTDGTTGWINYKTESETFTDLGTNIIEKTWFAPAGYAYRTLTKIEIKSNSTGKIVETATSDSPVLYK